MNKYTVLIVAGIALFYGMFELNNTPPYVYWDEAQVGLIAKSLLTEGINNPCSTPWLALPETFFYPPMISMKLFGVNLFGLRMSAVIMGMMASVFFFLLARKWFGETIAFCASLMLITNPFFSYLSKNGIQFVQATLGTIAALYLFDLCIQKRKFYIYILSGIVVGCFQYLYTANAILPYLWVLSSIYVMVNKSINIKDGISLLVVPLIFILITHIPLFIQSNANYTQMDYVVIWTEQNWHHQTVSYNAESNIFILIKEQLCRTFGSIFHHGDRSEAYGNPAPMVSTVANILLAASILIGMSRLRDKEFFLPALWTISIMFAGGVMCINPPFFPHFAGVPPLLFLLVAYFMFAVWKEKKSLMLCVTALVVIFQCCNFYNYCTEVSVRSAYYERTRMAIQDIEPRLKTPEEIKQSETYRFLVEN